MLRSVYFTEQRWLALWAAMFGYMLDALDVLLYVFAVQTLRAEFHWSAATAGLVSSATLLMSSVGGVLAGILAICLLVYGLCGWTPVLPLIRGLGYRTVWEIAQELPSADG